MPPADDLRLIIDVEPAEAPGGPEAEVTLRVEGDLDPHTAPQLDDAARRVLDVRSPSELVLDLAGVGFVDSAGLRVLLGLHKAASQGGGALVLTNLSAPATRLLELTRLNDEFRIR